MRFTPAPPGIVRCPKCGLGAPGEVWTTSETAVCTGCRSRLRVRTFPALQQLTTARSGEAALTGEAECFFHPEKKAERVCDRCGRFLCALCDLPIGARHLCPACVESGLGTSEAVPELVTRRTNWGRFALALTFVPFVPFFTMLAPASALAAIGCAVYGWRKPPSLVHGRARLSAIAAILIGLAEIAGLRGFFLRHLEGRRAWLRRRKLIGA